MRRAGVRDDIVTAQELGLFPLGTVLLPGELMPLHIFEERYKDLIAECLERELPFGLLYADEDGAREIGCTAQVVDVLQRFEDGRLNIVVRGGQAFRVLELTRGRSYLTGRTEALSDDPAAPAAEGARALELFRRAAALSGAEADVAVEGEPLSYALAARIELPAAEKQHLLELRSEPERLRALEGLLQAALRRLAAAAAIRERAAGNGKVVRRDR